MLIHILIFTGAGCILQAYVYVQCNLCINSIMESVRIHICTFTAESVQSVGAAFSGLYCPWQSIPSTVANLYNTFCTLNISFMKLKPFQVVAINMGPGLAAEEVYLCLLLGQYRSFLVLARCSYAAICLGFS